MNILVFKLKKYLNTNKLEFLKFGTVGVINTLINFIVFITFNSLLGFGYITSQILGYSCGVSNSYLMNNSNNIGSNH